MQPLPAIKLKRSDNLKATILPDGYLALFATATNYAYTLPPLSALAWEFLDGQHTLEEVVREVVSAVGTVDEPALRRELLVLIDSLKENGFVIETEVMNPPQPLPSA